MKRNISVFISVVSLVLSIVALCNAYPRSLGIDYLGWIVGLLALITAILLGWNIYTFFDVRENQKRYISIVNDVDTSQHKAMAVSEHANLMIYHKLLLGEDPCGLEFRFLYHGVCCIYHTSQFEDFKTCSLIVKALNQCFTSPLSVTMSQSNKMQIITLLKKVKGEDKIDGFLDLMQKVALIQTLS